MALKFLRPAFADEGSVALMKRLFAETGREFVPRYAWVIAINLVVAGTTSRISHA